MTQEIKEFDNLDMAKRKLAILVAGKIRKKNMMKEAVQIQDRLSEKSGSWNGSAEIKKWRERR